MDGKDRRSNYFYFTGTIQKHCYLGRPNDTDVILLQRPLLARGKIRDRERTRTTFHYESKYLYFCLTKECVDFCLLWLNVKKSCLTLLNIAN